MKKYTTQELVAVIGLIIAAVAYRVIAGEISEPSSWLPNFSPMAALVLCGAVFLPVGLGLVMPMAILLISDVILNMHFNAPVFEASMIARYLTLGALASAGIWLRRNPKPVSILAGSLAGSVVFYITTNTASWLALPAYAKNFAGWVQAMTVGMAGVHPTTIEFFRNSLVSDFLFTALILVSVFATREKEGESRAFAAS